MRSATAFCRTMITFMNLESSTEPNFRVGGISRSGISRRRRHFTTFSAGVRLAPRGRRDRPVRRHRAICPHPPATCQTFTWPVVRGARGARSPRQAFFFDAGVVLERDLLCDPSPLQVERTAHDVVAHARQVRDWTPRTSTTQLCRLWPSPPMYDDLETVGQAHRDPAKREFSFFGVVV